MSLEGNEPNRVDGGLRQDEGLFQALFSQAAVGMAQTSLTGKWLLVNNRLCEILGFSQAELADKTFADVTHPDDREDSLDALRQLLSGEISSWLREKRYIRKYGTIVWVRLFVSLVRDGANQPLYFIAVVEEVTDRILAERALEESQQQLRLALSTGLGVWECDLREKSVELSPQYRRVFGYSPLSYGEWMKLIHPDDLERVVAVAREGVERTHEWEAEFRVRWPDGAVRWMLSKAKVILDDNRQPARMVGISLDITERKRAEEQRSHLAAIVESADVAIVGEALDGTIVSWNSGAEMLYGYNAEEVLGRHISILVPQDRQNRIAEALETLRRSERIEQFETVRVRKNGHLFPVCITLSPVRDSSGAVIGVSAIARDITVQKQAEALLRQSEERFRATFFQAAVGITQTGRDGHWLLLNDRFCEILGYSQAELLGKTWLDVTHPDDREASLSAVRQLEVGEISSWSTEKRYIRKDGTTVWARLVTSVVRDEHNQPQYAISVVEDVTERKQAEAKLRESEERFRNMADSAPFGLWLTGPDGMVTYFNKNALQFTGLTVPQSGATSWTELVHPEDRSACQAAYSSAVADRHAFRIECRVRRADGKYRWVLCSGVPRFSPDGLFVGHLGTSVDITHVKRVHEAAMSAQKLESLGALAAGVAHDFNNLLGSILAQAELAETDLASGLMPSEEIQSIKTVAIRGAEIVRQLMVYAGREQPALVEAVDLSSLVQEIPELLKLSISKHAVLRTHLASDLPSVRGNAAQLRQVVMNLVINASEAIGEQQGIIKVTTAQVDGSIVLLEVSDTGCGMTEAAMARIFEPFFSTKFAGRGLGLAVAQGVVRAHGGEIKLSSTLAEGTTFRVFLPCTSERAPKIEDAIRSAAVDRSSVGLATVLIVEDEETLRSALCKDLRRRGYAVIEASNGHEAIHVFGNSKSKLDAVLLDLTIPGTSSREVLYELQAARPDLKVIVTSAYSREACNAFFTGLRVDHFMRKPFQLSELAGVLDGVCRPANLQPRVSDE